MTVSILSHLVAVESKV